MFLEGFMMAHDIVSHPNFIVVLLVFLILAMVAITGSALVWKSMMPGWFRAISLVIGISGALFCVWALGLEIGFFHFMP